MKKIVVSVRKDHPTGAMRRCDLSFTREPQEVEVTEEQLQIIEADQYLVIHSYGASKGADSSVKSDPIDYEAMTMSELKAMLTNNDVEFGARASKADLIKLAKEIK